MKIGVMLRHFEQKDGGVKVYTKHILPRLFDRAPQHDFLLMYQNPKLIGTYAEHRNVQEISIGVPGTVAWDQIGVPWAAYRHRVDLIFNPKFTVPLLGHAKKIFVLHGSEWFAIPDHFLWYDRLYLKVAVPFYFRIADAFIAVSSAVKRDAVEYVGADPAKITAIANGFDPAIFRVIEDGRRLRAVARKYSLPEHYILWVSQLESRKNVGRLLQAFARIKDEIPHTLVFAGAQRFSFPMAAGVEKDLALIDELGLKDRVHFTGWIEHADLPAVYCLADLMTLPSLHEGFGIPLLEAMACGCPIVTANTCAPPEVTAGAAYLVNPLEVDDIATGMLTMLQNDALRTEKATLGLQQARKFSWDRCVSEILQLFDAVVPSRDPSLSTWPRRAAGH